MTLRVGATPYSHWQQLGPLLHQLGYPGILDGSDETQIPDQDTAKGDSSPYLLLHTRPERAIAHALDAGTGPEKALAQWAEAAERLLAFYRWHREQAAMAEVPDAARHPKQFLDWLKRNHTAFRESDELGQEVQNMVLEERPSELNLLIATHLVAQNTGLKFLWAQIEACSIPLSDDHCGPPEVDVAAVYQEALEQRRHSQAEVEALKNRLEVHENRRKNAQEEQKNAEQKLKKENELIIAQLHKVQEELGECYLEAKDKTERLATATQTINVLKKERHAIGTEKYQLDKELKLADVEIRHARNKLHAMEHSISWRITRPLREIIRVFYKPARARKHADRHIALIKESEYFDPVWYLNNNSDVTKNGMSPIEHYVLHGGREGRAPSPKFNGKRYLKKYPDVAESGQNPLVHYLLHGRAEGRSV